MIGQTHCNDEQLHALLYADESSAEYERASQHVEYCESCRMRLEQLAASDEMWRDTQQALSGDEIDELLQESHLLDSAGDTAWHRLQRPKPSAIWSESIARQLLQPPTHPEMLGRLGRYEIERLIGSGGMGVVFKAFDTDLNRPVAIKVLAPHLAGIGAARQRFAREARAVAAVVHEHIVAIYNVESNDPAPFLVMQYVAGESLQQRIDRCGPLKLPEILRIAMQTSAGLAAAHAQGLVHRDIKPANILLEQGVERALLTDFGLARASDDASLTHTGYHLGTPQYMSPEQASGEPIDARSDLFSLGSVIYSMCTGRPPFRAETTLGVLRRISDQEPRPMREVNAEIPEWLEQLVARLHEKSADKRFSSAAEVRDLIQQCLAYVQQPTASQLPQELRSTRGRLQSLVGFSTPLRSAISLIAIACFVASITALVWQTTGTQSTLIEQSELTRWEWGDDELQKVDSEILKLETDGNGLP